MQNQGSNLPPDYLCFDDMLVSGQEADEDVYDKYVDDQLCLEAENNLPQ